MEPVVYLNGRFLAAGEPATVSLFDRGYLFGDSVFETLRGYRGSPFRLEEHLRRLEYSAGAVGIPLPASRAELAAVTREALARSGLDEAYIRITVSRGEGGGGIATAGCDRPVLSVVVKRLTPYPPEAYARGIRSAVVGTRKVPAACLDPAIKSGNYLPNIMARRELERLGMIEGVQLSVDGAVVSGTVSSLFVIRGDRLRTPSLASGCRPGVTRAAVLEVASRAGLRPCEDSLRVADLHDADEIFFANTLMECLPVAELDGRPLEPAPGPKTRAVHAALRELIERETGGRPANGRDTPPRDLPEGGEP